MWDTGRDREGPEPVEYWDSLCLDAWDMGRGIVDRRLGGEVISGGKAVWLATEEPGDGAAGGEVVGDVEDMTAVILQVGRITVMAHDHLVTRIDADRDECTGIRGSPHSVS